MTWISIKTGGSVKKRELKKHIKQCSICGKKYLGYVKSNRPNKYCLDCYKKLPKNTARRPEKTIEEKRNFWKLQKIKYRLINKKIVVKTKQKEKKVINTDPTEHEMWVLFWDYQNQILMKQHFNKKARLQLPKDKFELEIYKTIQMKFYTENFINQRAIQDRLPQGKNGS